MMKELEIINTINDIINILPVIFQYVVPGRPFQVLCKR